MDLFRADDYASVTEGSALHQVQNTFFEEYGIDCYVIKDSSWTRSSPAYTKGGAVYIRESIDPETLSTAVPHEATHIMKQQNFRPYIDFISHTPDALNLRSATIERLLGVIAKHKNIDPFNATSHQLFSFYDELNATVYGLRKSGVLDSNEFDFREYIPGAFHDFSSYIQEMERIHEEFRNRRNTSSETLEADGEVDALMRLANEVAGVSSGDMQRTLTNQTDNVSLKLTESKVGQPSETVPAANHQVKAAINPEEVANSLRNQGISSKKADGIADAVTARLNGQELTRKQRGILRSALDSPTVQNVISEFVQKKTDVVDSARSNVYDKDNAVADLVNSEEAALQDHTYQRVGGDRSGVPGTLGENAGTFQRNLPTARGKLKSKADAFSDDDYATVSEDTALHQVKNAFSKKDYGCDTSVPRPSWKQSETDVGILKPNYEAQKSFLNGKEVPYATRGSSRPDLYTTGSSIEVKNYNVTNSSGRNSLIRTISNQVNQRITHLPSGTKQTIIIDIRGQQVTNDVLRQIRSSILNKCDTDVIIQFMR